MEDSVGRVALGLEACMIGYTVNSRHVRSWWACVSCHSVFKIFYIYWRLNITLLCEVDSCLWYRTLQSCPHNWNCRQNSSLSGSRPLLVLAVISSGNDTTVTHHPS